VPHTLTFFEAPHRIRQTLNEAASILGERQILMARELTKYHQELLRGSASALAKLVSAPRGEYTVVVGPSVTTAVDLPLAASDEILADEFWQMSKNDALSRREAVKRLAQRHRLSAKDVYAAIERRKYSGK
jgi:16S rRNA (cytidine1402-2'-O)-methyltransferase